MTKPDFLLIGDSHAGAIGRAARETDLNVIGGPIGSGRDFFAPFFALERKALRFLTEEAQEHMPGFLQEAGAASLETLSCPLISTVGSSMHFPATRQNWALYRDASGQIDPGFLQSDLFAALIDQMLSVPMQFYRHLLGAGLQVFAVVAPQRIPDLADPEVYLAAQDRMADLYAGLGLTLIDLRAETTGADGRLLVEYCPPDDLMHANVRFGHLVLDRVRP